MFTIFVQKPATSIKGQFHEQVTKIEHTDILKDLQGYILKLHKYYKVFDL